MKEFGVERDKIIRRKRSRFEVTRDVGIYLLGRYSGLNNKRIGEVFGVGQSALSNIIICVNEQLNDKKELKNKVEKILNSTFKFDPNFLFKIKGISEPIRI